MKTSIDNKVNEFILKNSAGKIKRGKGVKYLLDMTSELRREIRVEALQKGVNMSEYITMILNRRHELKDL